MNRYFNPIYKKDIVNITPGDFFVSQEAILISTVLGSCISVAIFDSERHMGGLNHFMLVEGRTAIDDLLRKERYGLYAMESLLNEFYRTGSRKGNLSAKIFGGARIMMSKTATEKLSKEMNIGERNAEYARAFLSYEEIPLIVEDTGGIKPRRLFLDPLTFQVFVKKVAFDPLRYNKILKESEAYQKKLEEKKGDMGAIILFK